MQDLSLMSNRAVLRLSFDGNWPELMSAKEAASYLRICKAKVVSEALRGNVPGRVPGVGWRFLRRDLDAMFHRAPGETVAASLEEWENTMTKMAKHLRDRNASISNAAQSLPEVLTPKEVAAYLRISTASVIRRAHAGDIPGKQIGSQWRFSRRAIEGLL
jgi:excisionase family DNA binding protein